MATVDKARVEEILAQMESLEIALGDLSGGASRTNPRLYALMAEGPREHLRQLREQLRALLGAEDAERLQHRIEAAVTRPSDNRRLLGEAFDEALRGIVAVAHPAAIVLFGSFAEDRATRGSDVDLMIIAETEDSVSLTEELYTLWYAVQADHPELPPADILVFTPAEYEREYVVGFPAQQASLHGRVLYGRLPEQR